MKELFVSHLCGGCQALFARPDFFTRFGDCEQIDITESMPNLRRFLAYRDHLDGYASVRERGLVGVPSLIVDGKEVTLLS